MGSVPRHESGCRLAPGGRRVRLLDDPDPERPGNFFASESQGFSLIKEEKFPPRDPSSLAPDRIEISRAFSST